MMRLFLPLPVRVCLAVFGFREKKLWILSQAGWYVEKRAFPWVHTRKWEKGGIEWTGYRWMNAIEGATI
jgi:hypothetical protein